MPNPTFFKGMKAINPEGRPKNSHSVLSIKGMVERFVKRNMTPYKLQKLFNVLGEKDKLSMLLELLPYTTSKATNIDAMSPSDIDKLYDQLMTAIKEQHVKAS